LDLRPGAAIRIHKRGPDGTVYPMTGDHEIVKPERLVFTSAALGADGSPMGMEAGCTQSLERLAESLAKT